MVEVQKTEIRKKYKARQIAGKVLLYTVLTVSSLIMIYPLLFGIMGSLVTDAEFYNAGLLPLPEKFGRLQWANFAEIFKDERTWPAIWLTLVKYAFYAVVNLLTSVSLGYVFAKMQFKGKNIAFIYLLISMMIPGIALLVPNFVWYAHFPLMGGNNILGQGGSGLIDNEAIIFVLAWVSPYNIFLCRQALSGVPNDYKDAAKIDGMNLFSIIFFVYMPLIKSVVALMLFNQFCSIWNDYTFSLIFLPTRSDLYTIGAQSVQIASYFSTSGGSGITQYPKVFAIGIVTMIPPVVAYVFMQNYLVEGLTAGGIKG